MRRFTRVWCLLLFGSLGFSAHAAHMHARLLLAADTALPGQTVLAGLQLKMDSGWHTYWKNPGDSGMATRIDWQLPPGVTAGEIQWPAPEKLFDTNLTTYIYQDEIVALVPLTVAANAKPGPLVLKAALSWLECEIACIQGNASVEATLNVGSATVPSKDAALLESSQKKLPQSADRVQPLARWEGPPTGDLRPLIIEWSASAPAGHADFFPEASEQYEVQAATEQVPAGAGKISVRKQVKKLSGDWPAQIAGLLVMGQGKEQICFHAQLSISQSGPAVGAPAASGSPPAILNAPSLWKMLFYAFLGGLILNVMPCVLPVIALKILGFVNQAKEDPREVRKLGLIYTAGVLLSFLLLAGVVLGIKAAGRGVGWGFQFGNPYFLVLMTMLVTLVALNLFGLFEVTASGRALTAASKLSTRHGASGAFFNGLLATLLATSCSAPFLGAAVGFAFAQPAPIIISILLTVGAGLAAPYVVLSWHPAWLAVLPKPGPWMEKFKIAMGFPMLGAAVWVCSLLTIHYGERAWWMAVFLIFLAVAAWVYGEFVQRGSRHRALAALVAVAILGLGYLYAIEGQLRWRQPLQETDQAALPKEAPRGLAWKPWSPEAVAQARAEHRPVVVDFTAKWCPTCNTIVKPTLETASIQQKLKELNAVALLANYTRQPQAITDELRRFGRAGVPLVLVYPRDAAAPPIVFDLVTPGSLLEALDQAGH